ncbi:MAG: DNA recombination protein RmuC [Nitratireductor sp.]|nr:DNA recombination protein RmuC [Nitratireductor sp.]
MQPNDLALALSHLLSQTVLTLGGRAISAGEILAAFGAFIVAVLVLWLFLSWRAGQRRAAEAAVAAERAHEAETRMAELIATQNALAGRMQTMSEIFTSRQGDMMRLVDERLHNMSGRLGQSITETTKSTQESLAQLQERLAVIDTAQTNIQGLASQVVELQAILANKQTRGAFGEARMQAIVQDGLPQGAYAFQATLTNGARPDCLIYMPNDAPALVVDAKFPLEAFHAIRDAGSPETVKAAGQQFRRDVEIHIKAISEKYFLKGETQETAFMFVPSESIFAEIHENFEGLVQRAHRAGIVIVSPSLLMLSIQVVKSVLRDSQMREQAHLIQREVVALMEDLTRLDDRVRKLSGHFTQTQKDVEQILISTDKITRRGTRISEMDFEDEKKSADRPRLKAVE